MTVHEDPVRRFIETFNEGDLDGFAAVLDPGVELHSARGMRKGAEAARAWANRPPGGVQQSVVLDELYEDGDEAVALITRCWHWAESGEAAGEERMAWRFELREGRIASWRPYEDRDAALRDAGLAPPGAQ